jgi:predicted GNAT family N-acyltransferase
MMEIRSNFTDAEWLLYYDLRFRILRKHLAQEKGSEHDEGDSMYKHYALFIEDKIVAIGRLDFLNESSDFAQARFVAVETELQGKGFGKKIMIAMENDAKLVGKSFIVLHARDYAIPFYEGLGYNVLEKSHLLFGKLQHFKMNKKMI